MRKFIIIFVAMAMGACSSGGPEWVPFTDPDANYELRSCLKAYTWNGLWFSWKCTGSLRVVSNQPIFTSADDCHVAVHLIQQRDPDTWDNHNEAKKVILRASGYAYFLACFEV